MEQKKKPLSSRGLLMAGLLFAFMGILSRALAHGAIGSLEPEAMEVLMQKPGFHSLAVTALVLEALAVGGVPVFALLLTDGFHKGENTRRMLIGLGVLAILSEVPYNLVMLGKPFDMTQQNPVFGLLVCVAALAVFNRFPGKGFGPMAAWVGATLGAVLLCYALRIEYGLPMLLCTLVTWAFRRKSNSRMLGSVISAGLCVILSQFYLGAAAGLLPIYFYSGEHSGKRYLPWYAAYPAALLLGYFLTLVLQRI